MPTPSRIELPTRSTPRPGASALIARADPVHGQTEREAPLAAPLVGQLAAGDHQRRHDQQEHGDDGLHPLDGRVQVLADVGDHHVHVRAGEAADELGERQRHERLAQRSGRPCWSDTLSHVRSCLPVAGPKDDGLGTGGSRGACLKAFGISPSQTGPLAIVWAGRQTLPADRLMTPLAHVGKGSHVCRDPYTSWGLCRRSVSRPRPIRQYRALEISPPLRVAEYGDVRCRADKVMRMPSRGRGASGRRSPMMEASTPGSCDG